MANQKTLLSWTPAGLWEIKLSAQGDRLIKKNTTIIPSSLRLRSLHPLTDDKVSCNLVYDLERTLVFEVPKALRPSMNSFLKSFDMDEATTEWLLDEDLLTAEKRANWLQNPQLLVPPVTDVSLDISGNCNLRCAYCFENGIKSRTGAMSYETAISALEFIFKKSKDATRIRLHFGSGEPLMNFGLLRLIVGEANRRANLHGKEVSYELTTNATLVSGEVAAFLCDHPFNVRVSCDGPPKIHNKFRFGQGGLGSYRKTEKGLKLLLACLPDRLVVNTVISGQTRLSELWAWAKKTGLRHYHVIKVGADAGHRINLDAEELTDFRSDLRAICDEMLADLEAGRLPVDYQPITKIIRRLMIPAPVTRFCGVAGSYLGIASNGKIYPCFRHLGLPEYELGDIRHGADLKKRQRFLADEAADVDTRPVCQDCWARYLCGGACYADSVVYGQDRLKPLKRHCPFWQSEIETAIQFYNRLLRRNPVYCLRLFGDDIEAAGDSRSWGFIQGKNCS